MDISTYTLYDLVCFNCGWKGGMQIPKGTTFSKSPCPNCGCMTITRNLDALRNKEIEKTM